MAVISITSAKTAPGATTTASALAITWPSPALLVGADPAGDDVIAGYLGPWIAKEWVRPHLGVVSFAIATRHQGPDQGSDLAAHTQLLPGARNARVLLGLSEPAQITALGPHGWQRLASCLAAAAGPGKAVDAILDLGRFGPATSRPLLDISDLLLVAVRPQHRSVLAARPLIRRLRELLPPHHLGLAVLAADQRQAAEVCDVLQLPLGMLLPEDVATARALSDPVTTGLPRKTPLLRAATAAGTRLHQALNQPVPQQRLVGVRV
jgi:hypothetical protein